MCFPLISPYRENHNIELTPHQLRHAYATILYEAGIQVKDAQALLGHASAEITQEIYTHISENQQNKRATRVGSSFILAESKGFEPSNRL